MNDAKKAELDDRLVATGLTVGEILDYAEASDIEIGDERLEKIVERLMMDEGIFAAKQEALHAAVGG